ncbi:Defensin-like protein [Orobanche gracilis]
MASVTRSFCILLVLISLSVGRMITLCDTSTTTTESGVVKAELDSCNSDHNKKCIVGLGECGASVCTGSCSNIKCHYQFHGRNPEGYCNNIGSNQLCYCSYDC